MKPDTILIANRGEIAERVIRTAREMGFRCVAVYVDADSNLGFVKAADTAVRLDTSYLDGDAIVAAAQRSGATAIHPGYGFLSENADFAKAVMAAGLTWIGPSPDSIANMGDKLAAKAIAENVGVSILRSSTNEDDIPSIGYPLLIKAAAGGGGKGMRVVHRESELKNAVATARSEALNAFGDERVFFERYIPRARHIEIQILGDTHGNLIHLGERECSIQRRHQKIIEEAPSPRVGDELRDELAGQALSIGRALNYCSTGTVEFILDDDTGDFFFLEVNTRLQVEHPVTELVTGVDLVREQIRVAFGEELTYSQKDIALNGSAIEARLYAEDPDNSFFPSSGKIIAFDIPAEPSVRWDAGFVATDSVGTSFDPMIAKVISHAGSRREAARRLANALVRTHLGGPVTNRNYLVSILRSDAFIAGDTTTDFVTRVELPKQTDISDAELRVLSKLAALWIERENRTSAPVLEFAPSGWRNSKMPDQHLRLTFDGLVMDLHYHRERDGSYLFADGVTATVFDWDGKEIDAEVDGLRSRTRITRYDETIVVAATTGDLTFKIVPRFKEPASAASADGFLSPMPGLVVETFASVGDAVTPGEVLIVLEAMKMQHSVTASYAGTVSDIPVDVGDQVEVGTLLIVVEPKDAEEAAST
ncbi:biotin carboxylase N-terminal domain-containing protein [Pacificispira sp.]|uniref:ATP-binding protein n=1 Tax=Pacificispira sp. TaxID=2888761 RepID=UPI003B5249D8